MIGLSVVVVLHGGILFLASGDLRWWAAWAYLLVWIGALVVGFLVVSPALIEERSRIGEGAKRWDIPLAAGMAHAPALILLVAGLDHRWGWSPPLGTLAAGIALVGAVSGQWLTIWAMKVNEFFAPVCRIQTERGHHVVSRGPYRYVRHPGYTGALVWYVAAAVLLDSFWAVAPTTLATGVTVWRTALEDRTLRAELSGYEDYVQRVRFRLVPGVW